MPKIIIFDNPAEPFPQTNGGRNNYEIFGDIKDRHGVYMFQDRSNSEILYVGKAHRQYLRNRIIQYYRRGDSSRGFRKNWCEREGKIFDDFKTALSGWRIITISFASRSDYWINALEAILIGVLRPRYNDTYQ